MSELKVADEVGRGTIYSNKTGENFFPGQMNVKKLNLYGIDDKTGSTYEISPKNIRR